MTEDTKEYIEHEVQIRWLNFTNTDLYKKFDKLESKIDNNFKWTVGIMLTMFGGMILTKLI